MLTASPNDFLLPISVPDFYECRASHRFQDMSWELRSQRRITCLLQDKIKRYSKQNIPYAQLSVLLPGYRKSIGSATFSFSNVEYKTAIASAFGHAIILRFRDKSLRAHKSDEEDSQTGRKSGIMSGYQTGYCSICQFAMPWGIEELWRHVLNWENEPTQSFCSRVCIQENTAWQHSSSPKEPTIFNWWELQENIRIRSHLHSRLSWSFHCWWLQPQNRNWSKSISVTVTERRTRGSLGMRKVEASPWIKMLKPHWLYT